MENVLVKYRIVNNPGDNVVIFYRYVFFKSNLIIAVIYLSDGRGLLLSIFF